ncbi:hypothetical protein BH09PAT2_BH09PAT2_06950 [soil metagenome]
MAPDTQQNILYTIYFILLHNFEAIFYVGCIVLITLWALYLPTRAKIIILWGFIALLFVFEYNKHILEPLREQTINSLITVRQSSRIENYINRVTIRIIPRGLPILGWLLIIAGSVIEVKNIRATRGKKQIIKNSSS